MELRAGYKQTEVGLIPEDWAALPASEVGRFRGGTGFPLSYQGLQEGEIPFYKVSDMNNQGNDILMVASNNWISEEVRRRLGAHAFPAGSIVFAKVGAAVFLERKKILSRSSCLDNNMVAFVLNEELASISFVHSQLLAKKISDLVATTALPSLSGKVLGEMVLAIPPLPEQAAIAIALSDMDALLAAQDTLIAKKRAIKQCAMQELLTGKRRLPGFSGEWEEVSFSSVTWHHSGNSTLIKGKLTNEPLSGLFPAYSASGQDVWYERFEHDGTALIVSAVGSRCGKTFVATGKWSAIANTHVIWPNQELVDPKFLNCFLNDESFWVKGGTGQPFVLAKPSLRKMFARPGIEEQRAIMEVLSDIGSEIATLATKRTKTAQLKQGMMQELLTGRIRLI